MSNTINSRKLLSYVQYNIQQKELCPIHCIYFQFDADGQACRHQDLEYFATISQVTFSILSLISFSALSSDTSLIAKQNCLHLHKTKCEIIAIISLIYQINEHMRLNIYIIYQISPTCFGHTAPSSGRTLVTCSKLSAYCNVVTSFSKYKMYRMLFKIIRKIIGLILVYLQ